MKAEHLIWIYLTMVLFDIAVLAGTVWIITQYNWSVWWMALAVLMCIGSNPKYLIATTTGNIPAEYKSQ